MDQPFLITFATAADARAINKDKGTVGRVLRLFDALAAVDEEGILKDVRQAAAGESGNAD